MSNFEAHKYTVEEICNHWKEDNSEWWSYVEGLERHIRRGGHVKWEALSMLLENYRIGNVSKLESEVDNVDTGTVAADPGTTPHDGRITGATGAVYGGTRGTGDPGTNGRNESGR